MRAVEFERIFDECLSDEDETGILKHSVMFVVFGELKDTASQKAIKKYERLIRHCALKARQKKGITKPISEDIRLNVNAIFKMPNTYSKERRQRCGILLERPHNDSVKIAKVIVDGLSPKESAVCVHEGLYEDDKQIVSLKVSKAYGDTPKVEITALW